MPQLNVLDSSIFYEEHGAGVPLVFLHGNPTSSYLWRKVLPEVGQPGRCLAPDLIGMGRSGKPDLPYHFADHARYLAGWLEALALNEVVLIGHDWGGALACDWAARHPERIRGLVLMETIIRPMTWEEFPANARSRFVALRSPAVGERLVLDENIFIESSLPMTILSGLSEADWQVYRAPYPTRASRQPLLAWPRAMPLDGEPVAVVERILAYDQWLASSANVPKLLLTFDGSPTLLIGAAMAAWCAANIASLELQPCGAAGHLAPEDQPSAIANAIAAWLDRHHLR
jgi:haloalkane dehalogenase